MGFADLHVHTIHSMDGTATVRAVLEQAARVGLDVIAITDHDRIRGALEGMDLSSAYGVHVVPGCEVSTADGHLLSLFVQSTPPAGRSLADTIRWTRDQGGLCVAPHPDGDDRASLKVETIRQALNTPDIAPFLVGIEVFNASIIHPKRSRVTIKMAHMLSAPPVSNSDAHLLHVVGTAATWFPGNTPEDLREALAGQNVRIAVTQYEPSLILLGEWAIRMLLRYILGWPARIIR